MARSGRVNRVSGPFMAAAFNMAYSPDTCHEDPNSHTPNEMNRNDGRGGKRRHLFFGSEKKWLIKVVQC